MKFTGERYIPCEETENQSIEREHWQRYYFAQRLFDKNAKVLDIACGEGYGSSYLAQKLKYVIGIDISKEAVTHASKKYMQDNLQFLEGNVSKIPLEDCSVDGIVSFETIEHVDEEMQIDFLKESKRILNEGGIFVVSCPNKNVASDLAYELWGYTNIYHKKEYEIDTFELLLKKFYKNVKLLYQRTETNLVLSTLHPECLKVIWGDRKTNIDTQNIIAVCSDAPITEIIPDMIILDIDNSYLSYQKSYSDLAKAHKEATNLIFECKKWLTTLQDKIEGLKTDLEQRQNEIDKLKFQKTEYRKKITLLETEIKNLEEEKGNLQKQLQKGWGG